ncbi:ABC transporter substrate-binding protein [Bradyrhizobium genosp. A]|uniref:ABC transporter substrate-binding protein n=1 Tax=Bradyrhizobium genosp. A TaxID=83626 RepID=UPI003CF7A5CA
MSTRHVVFGLTVSLVLTCFIGQANAVELNVLYTDPNFLKNVQEEIARKFKSVRPDVNVHLRVVADYDQAIQSALRDGLTGGLPDLAFHGIFYLPVLVERKLIVPLDGYALADSDWYKTNFSEPTRDIGKLDGKIYGIPFAVSLPTVFYNLDLVKQAGGDPARLPATWDELSALSKRITAPSGGIYFTYESTANWSFAALLQSLGSSLMNSDRKKIGFDNAKGIRALDILRQIGEARHGNDMSKAQARQAFSAGSLGILIDSASGLANYETQAGNRFRIRTAPMPIEAADNGSLPPTGNVGVIFAADPSKQQAAWDYLKFATGPEMQTLMAIKTGYAPTSQIAVSRDDLLGGFYQKHPNSRIVVDEFKLMRAWSGFPGDDAFRLNEDILNELQAVVTLRRTPADALTNMVKDTTARLPKQDDGGASSKSVRDQ